MFFGLDTSAYTSSLALVDEAKRLVWEGRQLLKVNDGQRGLAQSEALFQHLQVLPGLIQKVPYDLWPLIQGIGVSTAPRPAEGSYMPVFTAGTAIAASLACALNVKLVPTTHQEGHLSAGLESATDFETREFLAVHLSGGTTELLRVKKDVPGNFVVQILGASRDLHAGQFIDRVGVKLGLPFPAGRELEKLALNAAPGSASLLPSSVKEYEMSFSGVETAAQRMIEQGKRPADLARAVEGCIVRTLVKVLEKAIKETGLRQILMVGGVAANQYLRREMEKKFSAIARIAWARTDWSSDNAIGVALLTRETLLR